MNDSSINAIAKKANVNPSVVSRVLRHCSGVDSETRLRILAEAGDVHNSFNGHCPVYAIIPDVPRSFWGRIRRGVADTLQSEGIPFKANICTKVEDEAVALQYIDEAERMDAQAIILAVSATPAILQRLDKFTEDRLVLFLSEYCGMKNAFYCGSNAFQDGYKMGKYFMENWADRTLILMEVKGNLNSDSRIEGFLKAVSEMDESLAKKAVRIVVERKHLANYKLTSSKLAPLLVNAAGKHDRLAIYVPAGIPNISLAVSKADLAGRTVLLCQDYSPARTNVSELISVNQSGLEQGRTAAKLASAFVKTGSLPSEKRSFVSSTISIHKKPAAVPES
ncbi:MAG: LacI family DNA-binding transcriptional regulator [Lachnospiraceae bacterium]|nr:LacI family DNA-binding transcriptional regulator [Lachnospiraceae bacterium]